MKKTIFFLVGIMMVSSIGFSAEANSLEGSLDSIESHFNELVKKEEAQKEAYRQEKEKLESEIEDLKARQEGRDKLIEKLKVDAEVRWHRDKYKNILQNVNTFYKKINKSIAEKEKKVAELDALLSVMN